MINIFIIMLCWIIDMPLWLSIVGTIVGSLNLLCDGGVTILKIVNRD